MTNPSMAEKPDVVPLLRRADRELSTAIADPRLKLRLLAAIDAQTLGNRQRTPLLRSWAVPALVFAAALAFVSICVDDDPAPRNVQIDPPSVPEDLMPLQPDPIVKNPAVNPFRSEDGKERPSTNNKNPLIAPHSPHSADLAPDASPKAIPGPRKNAPPVPTSKTPNSPNPKLRLPEVPAPHSSVRKEQPLTSTWRSPPVVFSPALERSQPSFPNFGGSSSDDDEPGQSRPGSGPKNPVGLPDKPNPDDESFEVHVIGIYEADAGSVSIHLGRSGSAILVLSAYAATSWTVTIGPDTDLQAIYVLGYEAQKVVAAPDTKIIASSFEGSGEFLGCGYEWPDMDPVSGCETPDLLAAIKVRFGLNAQSFHGCYAASSIALGDEGAQGICAQGYPFTGFP